MKNRERFYRVLNMYRKLKLFTDAADLAFDSYARSLITDNEYFKIVNAIKTRWGSVFVHEQ